MEGLTTITIKDQPRQLYFGMMALEQFTRESGQLEEGSVLQMGQITCLVYAGLKNASFRNREILPVSFADVCDAVEEKFFDPKGQNELAEVVKAFTESKTVKGLAVQTEEVKKKKRSTGTR
jgi:hypothetical protein